MNNIKPNKKEKEFLNIAYNSFYDLYNKYRTEKKLSSEDKFVILIKIFSIYTECLRYEPVKYFIKFLEKNRSPGNIISLRYFEIIRHVLIHFPFFNKWSDVFFNRALITWNNTHSKIDLFLIENEGKEEFKWRIWNNLDKKMTYGYKIAFPKNYKNDSRIYLKDLIDEKQGIDICLFMIKKVLESQVELIKDK